MLGLNSLTFIYTTLHSRVIYLDESTTIISMEVIVLEKLIKTTNNFSKTISIKKNN